MSCKSISGERRISPGPAIYEGAHWVVEHAYPCGLQGWLVLVLKRHAEALHELSGMEWQELGELLPRVSRLLHSELGCSKEYVTCFAEAPGFQHVHMHVVAVPGDLPVELKGPGIFAMLKVEHDKAVSPQDITRLCERLAEAFPTKS